MEGNGRRTRVVEWADPAVLAAAARSMPGLDFLRAIAAGELPPPPIAASLGFGGVEVEPGRVVFEVTPAEYHYNPIGTVHGGVMCTLADSAMGCAVHSALPPGVTYTSLEVKVSFLKPVTTATGALRCEGRVISLGSRVATAEARLTGADGTLYGHATTTCLLLRP